MDWTVLYVNFYSIKYIFKVSTKHSEIIFINNKFFIVTVKCPVHACSAENTECVYVPSIGKKCLCYELYIPNNVTDPEDAGCNNTIPGNKF